MNRRTALKTIAGMSMVLACSDQKQQSNSESAASFLAGIGVCTFVENSAILKQNGCTFVEESVSRFLMPLEPEDKFLQVRENIKSELPVFACKNFIPKSLPSVGENAAHQEILKYAETAFKRANQTGVKVIVFGSGKSREIPDGYDRQKAWQQFVELLSKMAPLAEEQNVTVALEPLNSSETNFINSLADGIEIVKAVDHPNIRLLVDIYHMLRENESPEEIIAAAPFIAHCHIAEKEQRTAPGTLGDDFTAYFKVLKQINYAGHLSMECRWENLQEQLPRAMATLRDQTSRV